MLEKEAIDLQQASINWLFHWRCSEMRSKVSRRPLTLPLTWTTQPYPLCRFLCQRLRLLPSLESLHFLGIWYPQLFCSSLNSLERGFTVKHWTKLHYYFLFISFLLQFCCFNWRARWARILKQFKVATEKNEKEDCQKGGRSDDINCWC